MGNGFCLMLVGMREHLGALQSIPPVGLDHEDGEFVAAESGDDIGFPHLGLDHPGNMPEDDVADMVAMGVVDVLKGVEIAEHEDAVVAIPFLRGQGAVQVFVDTAPVA